MAGPSGVLTGYHEVLYWRIADRPLRMAGLQLAGLLSFVVFGILFLALAIVLGHLPSSGEFSITLSGTIAVVVTVVLTYALHELIHALMMRVFGAKPVFGAIWKKMLLYTSASGFTFRRNDYLIVLLAPFVLISGLALLGMMLTPVTGWVFLIVLCATLNAAGAIGDLWMTTVMLRFPTSARALDERDGVRIFLPGSPAEAN